MKPEIRDQSRVPQSLSPNSFLPRQLVTTLYPPPPPPYPTYPTPYTLGTDTWNLTPTPI
jgi:hypothetical protein